MNRCVLTLALAALMSGCASQQSTLMRRSAQLDTTPSADAAVVVFVRGSGPRDDGWPFRVVDESGRFLGECVPASKFAVRLPPGQHALFAWEPGGDIPPQYAPFFNQVGALRVTLEAGKTYTVSVGGSTALARATFPFLSLRLVNPSDLDVAEELRSARPFAPDATAGQAALDREQASLEQHLALGMIKLGR